MVSSFGKFPKLPSLDSQSAFVGTTEGAWEGMSDGTKDGDSEGETDGDGDGAREGFCEGMSINEMYRFLGLRLSSEIA